jgi:hypothetical protein
MAVGQRLPRYFPLFGGLVADFGLIVYAIEPRLEPHFQQGIISVSSS